MMVAVVEIPKGSRKKIEIKANGEKRVIYKTKKRFIANYGRILHTVAGDGDNADVFVLGEKLKIGDKVDVVFCGIVEYTHRGREDNKLIGYTGTLDSGKIRQFQRLVAYLSKQDGYKRLGSENAACRYVLSKRIYK